MALQNLGFNDGIFVGITPYIGHTSRGKEINAWLCNHPEVTDYAILDDDSDMLPEQMCKFHHCDGWFGLTPNHLYRVKKQFDDLLTYEHLTKTIN